MEKEIQVLDEATIRFAGDSGDGMQLTGTQFSQTAGAFGNHVNTFPDYPSEIRAPEGTLYGVSAYQVQFGSKRVHTPGNKIDVLVAMNASALKVNLPNVKTGGIIIANSAGFGQKNLTLAKYEANPLKDGSLDKFKVFAVNITQTVQAVLSDLSNYLTPKQIEQTKNLWALGLTYWLFDKPMTRTVKWLSKKFAAKPNILRANLRALEAGYNYGSSRQEIPIQFQIRKAVLTKGIYRNITGNEATAIGLVVAAKKAKLPLFLGSYPITPATEILHFLSGYKKYGVKHLQAEDEIAGICSAIGAAYGGYLSVTTTSGPGLSLKVEAMGLALMLEIPLIIVDVQRAGPSTGLPTKPEQSDLLMAMYGRHGEAPLPIVAAKSAADCFDTVIEAARIAIKYMTPVIMLSDGYIAQGTNPWKIPSLDDIPDISPKFATNPNTFKPYKRDSKTLARPWAVPGTPGCEHRIGGLEKEDITGVVSTDAMNHQKMCDLRAKKIENIANDIPRALVQGEQQGDLLILGWGGTYGAIQEAFDKLRSEGLKVSYCHLTHINPFPSNILNVLKNFKQILVPELNSGQLKFILQAKFMIPIIGLNKLQGLPLKEFEVEDKVKQILKEMEDKENV